MARTPHLFVLCLALVALAACAGPRAGSGCAPACAPACASACDPCASGDAGQPQDAPPQAKDGEAWCRVWIPPVNRTETVRVLVSPERTETVRIPAEYGARPKLVCVAPAKHREIVKPAVWTHKQEEVMVRPGCTVAQRVDCDASNLGPCEQQGECWVKKKLPPVFETRCRAVCLEPPKKTIEYTPAKYEMRDERFLLRPARCETHTTPARYEERTRIVCGAPGRWEWRRNDACEIPVPVEQGLPALEVEMVDSAASGEEQGIFKVGSVVRYDLTVRSDVGSEAFPILKVIFSLPEQLQFISGGGQDVEVTGAGQGAASSSFRLPLEKEVKLHILAKVLSMPPTNYVQATASIQTEDGEELTVETESTTLSGEAEK